MATGLAVHALVAQVSHLTTQFQQLQTESAQQPTALNPPAVPPADHTARYVKPRLPPPAVYSGEPQLCHSFLAKCSLHIALQPSSFPAEESNVAFSFSEELKKVFDRVVSGREAARVLAELRQGNQTVTDYSIEFRTLAAECNWNMEAQWDMFLHGLADRIHNEIYSQELPATLDELIDLAIRVDARLRRQDQRVLRSPVVNTEDRFSAASTDTVGGKGETQGIGTLFVMRRCPSYCCSVPGKSQSPSVGRRLLTALIDSGAEGNFLDFNFAHELGIPVILLTHPIAVSALSGQSLPPITHTTGPDEHADLSNTEYLDLKGVFSKSRAASLPPHHPYDSFERLQGASFFTKLDLRNVYHLVRIREGDEWKTAFNTPRGHFEYLVMPFGLSNAPAVFQALVNDVLKDMIDQFIYVYLDDILIFSHSLQEHVQHVRRVLQRLLENGLYVKAEKCIFHVWSVPFLGYVVSSEGVRMDPDKVQGVVHWPTPDSRKALQRFLGFANFYQHFIRNYSQVATPLTALTSTKTTFRLSSLADTAFSKLKSRFVLAPILVAPDLSHQFVVEVDASEVGVGTVLSQRSSADGKMHPCTYFSHRLSPAELNYDIGNRELLAIKLALEEWRHWTDHKNLDYISPGSKNNKPDALSHVFDQSERPLSPEPILPQKIVVSMVTWEIKSKVHTALQGVTPPPECPPSLRSDVIHWGHYSKVACHPGSVPPLRLPVDPLLDSFNRFQLLQPWSHISLDFVMGLPPSQGNTVVLTVVGRFSKATHFIPLPKIPSARETMIAVIDHVFRIHGLPTDVVSDRGPQFVSKFWKEFCFLLGASVSLSSGFHPQSNGQTERANQDLERVLRCMVSQNPSSRSQQLSWVEYAHNSLPVSATGLSLFECSLGYQPPIFPSMESEVTVPSAHAFVQRCRCTWRKARHALLQVRSPTKAQADRHQSKPPVYVIGQKVWLSSKNIPLRTIYNKLAPKFIGPFTVTKIISPVAVRLKLPPAYRRIHPVFHVSKLKPVFHSTFNLPAPVPPTP
ncbi:Transposon Tf2-6 polyprotein [Labeo rohita]|uniref:ribonuclease H n=1 Tax=Labeo rohita TaxID=84645 RepID=A0ABQ8MEP2_LABRO|nr:Transposon Tf2-6 polyprotein [Labeo rohita]